MAHDAPSRKALFDAEILTAQTSDPAEFELALRPWELLCTPRRAGDFQHQITAIRSAKFTLYRERYSLPIRLQGLSPAGMFGISLPLDQLEELNFWGQAYSDASMVATLPGAADAVLGSEYAHAVALIDIDHLQQAMPNDAYERLEAAARSHVFAVSRELIDGYSRWINRLLSISKSRPELFEDSLYVEKIFLQLTDFLLRVSTELPPSHATENRITRQLGLSRSLDYLRDQTDGRVSVADLCRVACVSERTLQHAFRDEFGMSPSEFMRRRRLHAVRQKLITSSADTCSVSQVALEHGFCELGRFAGEYRSLFGLRPSDSLRGPRKGNKT